MASGGTVIATPIIHSGAPNPFNSMGQHMYNMGGQMGGPMGGQVAV